MALGGSRRRDRGLNYWPGFVDALSTLLLAIVFLLSVFMLAQFFLSQEIAGKETALVKLNRQLAELSDLLALERGKNRNLEDASLKLQATLRAAESLRLQALVTPSGEGEITESLVRERQAKTDALTQVELLNQQIAALRRQLAALEDALSAGEARDKDSQTRLSDLGARLNIALAQRVQELARYRSDFFGRLRQVLGERSDIRIVGDRFVFQSEVLFPASLSNLRPEALGELDRMAAALIELEKSIPPEIPWILRVDGHTDNRPIATAQFPSNWALSTARAVAVVQYLIAKGVSPQRLAAAGFGEFQPLELGASDEAHSRNRRIELKLTER